MPAIDLDGKKRQPQFLKVEQAAVRLVGEDRKDFFKAFSELWTSDEAFRRKHRGIISKMLDLEQPEKERTPA